MIVRKTTDLVKNWWQGRFVSPAERNSGSDDVILVMGTYKRHWTSEAAHAIWNFWCRRWIYLVPTIVMAIVLLFIHADSKPGDVPEHKPNEQRSSNGHVDLHKD